MLTGTGTGFPSPGAAVRRNMRRSAANDFPSSYTFLCPWLSEVFVFLFPIYVSYTVIFTLSLHVQSTEYRVLCTCLEIWFVFRVLVICLF